MIAVAWNIFFLAALIVIVRFILGHTFADRLISLDVLGQLMILFFVYLAIGNSAPIYLDIALTFALLLFIGTVAVSNGSGKRGSVDDNRYTFADLFNLSALGCDRNVKV